MNIIHGADGNAHDLVPVSDTDAAKGWLYARSLRLFVKVHQHWQAEIWLQPDRLSSARLRIYNTSTRAEWLDATYPNGTTCAVPFRRADQFMIDGQMPGWGEWPSEATSRGRVPMPQCRRCRGPISHRELVTISDRIAVVYPYLAAWNPRFHRSCLSEFRTEQEQRLTSTLAEGTRT